MQSGKCFTFISQLTVQTVKNNDTLVNREIEGDLINVVICLVHVYVHFIHS